MIKLLKAENKEIILDEIEIADTIWKRFSGLMFKKKIPSNKGMLLRPSNSVHTFFMKFPIDVIFVDKNDQVIRVVPNMQPYRISPIVFKSTYIIESRPNILSKKLKVGDKIELFKEAT